MMRLRAVALSLLVAAWPAFSSARAPQSPVKPSPLPNDSFPPPIGLRVFLDCNFCDFDFMRTEINFVDYVRDRQDAQVHILVTQQQTGGGGTEYTLHFIGLRELGNISDTLKYVSPPGASPDDLRHGLARSIRLSLVRYYVHLGQVGRFVVTFLATYVERLGV